MFFLEKGRTLILLIKSIYIFLSSLSKKSAIIKYKCHFLIYIFKDRIMLLKKRNAFTLLELTFVIVIIGILSAVAIPRFAATRDDAVISKARSTVSAVRNAIATERQRRILKGDLTHPITALNLDAAGAATNVFDRFNPDRDDIAAGTAAGSRVLEYPIPNCATLGKTRGCWQMSGTNYRFTTPDGTTVDFTILNAAGAGTNRFDCVTPTGNGCKLLTQ